LRRAADTSAGGGGSWYQLVHRCREAADEIERLRAEVREQHQVGTDLARLRTEVGSADALANMLRALVAEQHDEIERLRAALRSAKSVPHGCSTGFVPCWCES
jgi:predicted RNase H-like nuclease (RuvC/YqgF family)